MGGREEAGKIFVGGLSWNTDQNSLQSYFSQYGEITDCIVMKNPQTGKSRGFGFVSFKDPATVDVILSSKNHTVDGRTVDAKACNARGTTPKPPSRGGFGGGGGGGGGMTGRTTKIFVGGLPNNATEDTIREAFQRFGNVTEVVIMFDHEKGRSRGFGFLTFDNEDSVEQACGEHYVDVNGKQVTFFTCLRFASSHMGLVENERNKLSSKGRHHKGNASVKFGKHLRQFLLRNFVHWTFQCHITLDS